MELLRHLLLVLITLVSVSESRAFNITGDVTLVGLFKVHDSYGDHCGTDIDVDSVMTVEAVKWYIRQLNRHGDLPLKIGFEAHETCHVTTRASEVAAGIVNRVLRNERIIGVIGPEFSSESEPVSYILGSVHEDRRVPHVGFSATATGLGDRVKYPNFVRVIPSDNVQVNMMIQSMVRMEWNRIALIYEDDTYGQSMRESFTKQAKQFDICISLIKNISVANGYSSDYVKSIINDVIEGTGSRPYISGIVYIGFSRAANTMFHHLSNSPYSSVPVVMLSEGVGLDVKTFTDNTGALFSKAKGSLVSSPPYHEVKEFTQYWNQLFTNDTLRTLEAGTNPWLDELYQAHCTTTPCAVGTNRQSVFIYYAISAAHALIKSVTEMKNHRCPQQTGLCIDFVQKQIMQYLTGTSINFNTDFSWRPDSLADYASSIDGSGELRIPNTDPTWELYNFRSAPDDIHSFTFVKVGEMLKNSVNISYDGIRDYLDASQEVTWPEVRKAQCPTGGVCVECSPRDQLEEDVLVELGDVYIVGVAPVSHKQGLEGCGAMRADDSYQIVESMRLPVLKVNKKSGDYKNFFPGAKVGLIVLNSCMSTAVIQRKIYTMHKHGVSLNNGTVIPVHDKILGFVGEYTSTVSMAIADTLTVLGYAQISYASTSPALSDRIKYPYFLRVVTPDDAQARAMVEIMKKLDVTYAQILYSAGAYGEDGKAKVKELAAASKICIINEIAIDYNTNPLALYEQLRQHSHAKMVIIFMYPDMLLSLTKALTNQMKKGEFVFIGSEAWARNTAVTGADTNHVLQGSITVSLEIYQDRELRSHIQDIQPQPYRENPWSQMYVQTKRDCYFDLSFDKSQSRRCSDDDGPSSSTVLDTYDTAAYIATTSLLIGANNFLKTACGTSAKSLCPYYTVDGLVKEILNTKLDLDGSGPMKVFDSNGNGNVGYRIYNIQRDPDQPQKLRYEEIGRYPLEGTFTFETDKLVYPTSGGIVSKCPNEQACETCLQRSDTEGANTDSTTGVADTTIVIVLASCLGLVGLCVLIMCVCLWCTCRNKGKTSNPFEGYAAYIAPRVNNHGNKEKHYKREEVTESKIYLEIGPQTGEARYSNAPRASNTSS